MTFCAAVVQLDRSCSCFTRQVAACALQDEVHRILYLEPWQPTCNPFPAMQYQQDNNPNHAVVEVEEQEDEDDDDKRVLTVMLCVACGLVAIVSLVACRLSRSVKILADEVATHASSKPKTATVKVVDPAKAQVVELPSGDDASALPEAKPEAPAAAAAPVVEDLEAPALLA